MLGSLREQEPDEIRPNEAGAADDKRAAARQRPTGSGASACFRWVNVSATLYSR
jgi:hypothetical protein